MLSNLVGRAWLARFKPLFHLLSRGRVHEALVVDVKGRLLGMVTQTDLLAVGGAFKLRPARLEPCRVIGATTRASATASSLDMFVHADGTPAPVDADVEAAGGAEARVGCKCGFAACGVAAAFGRAACAFGGFATGAAVRRKVGRVGG